MKHLVNLILALLSLMATAEAKDAVEGVRRDKPGKRWGAIIKKGKECNGKKCSCDLSDLPDDPSELDSIIMDFGNGDVAEFTQNGPFKQDSFHGEDWNLDAMNLIVRSRKGQTRGKTSKTVVGSISHGDKLYKIQSDKNGKSEIIETDWADYPDEAEPEEAPQESFDERMRRLEISNTVERRTSSVVKPDSHWIDVNGQRELANDLGDNIDVMVVWSPFAECRQSGESENCALTSQTTTNILALIDLAISETNAAYDASGVNTQLRLVHAYRVDYDESQAQNSNDNLDFGTALSELRTLGDGVIDDVHSERTKYGADVVAMIVGGTTYCGIANVGPAITSMFSVTSFTCATGYFSFGHEIGHNMGCLHDLGTSNACSSSNYHYGWRDPDAAFRTILAYNCVSGQCDGNAGGNCPRIQRFSTPSITYNGEALGSAIANNAQQINDVKGTIAAYFPVGGSTNSPTPSPTPCFSNVVEVTINTDNYPGETTWGVEDSADEVVASGGPYASAGTTYVRTLCLPDGDYTFTIFDSYGDGLCCSYGSGSYEFALQPGNVILGGSTFANKASETTPFTLGSAATGAPTESPTKNPTGSPSAAPSATPTSSPTPSPPPTAFPTGSPSSSPSATPTSSPTPSPPPTAFPSGSPSSSPSATPTSPPTPSPPPTTSPTPAPTPPPTPGPTPLPTPTPTPPPTPAPVAVNCAPLSGGNCRNAGCRWLGGQRGCVPSN